MMVWIKSPWKKATFSVALLIELAIASSVVPRAAFSAIPSPNLFNPVKLSLTFEPPEDEGAPAGTGGTASRGPSKCAEDTSQQPQQPLNPNESKPFLTAVMPTNQKGLTVSAHPTFFIYVPKTSLEVGLFSLYSREDENNNSVYQIAVPLTKTPGIISVSLPSTALPLEIGKDYSWELKMICDPQNRYDGEPFVYGWIERREPNPILLKALEKATPLERAALYAKNGIWYEALTTLAEIRRSQPDNDKIRAEWEEFLRSVGLDAIAPEPLLEPK